MDATSHFLPMDRRWALARDTPLPDQIQGAALFADLAGFTPLTSALVAALGPQRGADQLTLLLNRVYEALITAVHHYGGSTVSFSGDAILSWFDGDSGQRATTAALAMQAAMGDFAAIALPGGDPVTLTLKCAVAAGPLRRFVVGDPAYRLSDVLAGATLDALIAAEHQTQRGEVVLTAATAHQLAGTLTGVEWRSDPATGVAVAQIGGITPPAAPCPWPAPPPTLSPAQAQAWVHPAVAARLGPAQEAFLAEIRPVVPLFLRFGGLDYDGDPRAGAQLDGYIRWVQGVLARYDAALLSLTIGDKGSYLHTAFGAPVAHSDDARRAVAAALELRDPPPQCAGISAVQIGITRGVAWAGAYGAQVCRTYDVQGDPVNLAARLMAAAPPGGILATPDVQAAAGSRFTWRSLPPLAVKGKPDPIAVVTPTGSVDRPARTLEAAYPALLVGRADELATLTAALATVPQGAGRVIILEGEAGIGKSRLVAEAIRHAQAAGWAVYSGAAEAYGIRTAYLAWQSIWRAFFDLEVGLSAPEQADRLAALSAAWGERVPLLGAALGLTLADNAWIAGLDSALRKSALEALLVECLHAQAAAGPPILLVVDDAHWLDPLSHDLLLAVARALADLPVLLLVATRPTDGPDTPARNALQALVQYRHLALRELAPAAAAQLVAARLGGATRPAPPALVDHLVARAAGNPFYLEELINYLADRHINVQDTAAWTALDWPSSLQSLLLARIDQLSEPQRQVLKVASVVGRVFALAELWGVYPALGTADAVRADFAVLARLDLTPLDSPEPDLRYIFKHQLTQEVTYGSLPPTMCAGLHEQFAGWLESGATDADRPLPVPLLAYHYGQSNNTAKQRTYYRLAGDAAQADYANAVAVSYYERLLPLLAPTEQPAVLLALAAIHQLTGRWATAQATATHARQFALANSDSCHVAQSDLALGTVWLQQGAYDEAHMALAAALTAFEQLGDTSGQLDVLLRRGQLYWRQHQDAAALTDLTRHQALATQAGDLRHQARVLIALGNYYWRLADLAQALTAYEGALTLGSEAEDRMVVSHAVGNLGLIYKTMGDFQRAATFYRQNFRLLSELGARQDLARLCGNIANLYNQQGEYEPALRGERYKIQLCAEMGDRRSCLISLCNITESYRLLGRGDRVQATATLALALARQLHDSFYGCHILLRWAQATADMGGDAEALSLVEQALVEHPAINKDETAVVIACLAVGCRVRLGQQALADAQTELAALADHWPHPNPQAEIAYTLWQLDPTAAHRQVAATALAAAEAAQCAMEHRTRYIEVTGTELPAPPPLPPLLDLIPSDPPPLDDLLTAVARLIDPPVAAAVVA